MLRKVFLTAGFCMSLAACQTLSGGGNDKYSTAALAKNLKVGATTSQEVRSLYGKPDYSSDGPSGPVYWRYNIDDNMNSLIDKAMGFLPIGGAEVATDQMKNDRSLHVHFEKNRVSSYSIDSSNPK